MKTPHDDAPTSDRFSQERLDDYFLNAANRYHFTRNAGVLLRVCDIEAEEAPAGPDERVNPAYKISIDEKRELAVSLYQTRNSCSFQEAWDKTRAAHPELFGDSDRGCSDIVISAAHAAISTDEKRDLAVTLYQTRNGCSFQTAWDETRAAHPELFND